MTSLPPITSEVFTEKVLAAQASSTAAATKASYEKTCRACEKTYFSENAYVNHVGSQKHRARVAQLEGGKKIHRGDDETSSIQSSYLEQESSVGRSDTGSDTEEEVIKVAEDLQGASLEDGTPESNAGNEKLAPVSEVDLKRCLFCNYESPTILLNVTHMERIHSMFIPERNYLVDLNGLLTSLIEKINEFHECLYCGKLKPTVFGLQTHMRDKGHCKIPFATEDEQLEIGDFYDFTSTYSDEEDEESDEESPKQRNGGVKLGAKRPEKTEGDDDEDMEDADGWETDSSASSLDSADLTAVPLDLHTHQYEKLNRHPHHSSQDPRPHLNPDGFHSHAHKHTHAAFYSDYELHLPSGRAVGHRSLAKYYKQNLHSHPSPSERQEQLAIREAEGSESEDEQVARRNDRERGRQLATRANPERGLIGVTDQKKREVQVREKKARKQEERERRRFQWGNNKQGNFQKHFRVGFTVSRVEGSLLTSFRILSSSRCLSSTVSSHLAAVFNFICFHCWESANYNAMTGLQIEGIWFFR